MQIPLVEKNSRIDTAAMLYNDPASLKRTEERIRNADTIYDYLFGDSKIPLKDYYSALTEILKSSPRAALYVPFADLKLDTPGKFRAAYLHAWRECWNDEELRSDYTQGDIGQNAQSRENQPIVKAFHITPWLLRSGLISPLEIDEIIERFHDNKAAMSAITDCIEVFKDEIFFNASSIARCSNSTLKNLNDIRASLVGYYDEEAEKSGEDSWNLKLAIMHSRQIAHLRNITRPFEANVNDLSKAIRQLEYNSEPKEITLLGGAKLKGYTAYSREFHVYEYYPETNVIENCQLISKESWTVPDPEGIHACFNTVWVGIDDDYVLDMQTACAKAYFETLKGDSPERKTALMTLENDILRHRLMHKGFPYAYKILSPESAHLSTIDGNSAFYDSRYRENAICLMAKYVHLP